MGGRVTAKGCKRVYSFSISLPQTGHWQPWFAQQLCGDHASKVSTSKTSSGSL
jgi:hypothetical protein